MFRDGYIHTLVTGGYLDTSQLFLSRKTGLEKRSPIIKDMGIIALFPHLPYYTWAPSHAVSAAIEECI